MEYSHKHIAAIQNTIYNYEYTIELLKDSEVELDTIFNSWIKLFGKIDKCMLCHSVNNDCNECVLGPDFGCEFTKYPYKVEKTKENLILTIKNINQGKSRNKKDKVLLKRALQQRLKFLVKRMLKNGIILTG